MKHLDTAGLLKNAPVTYVICKIDCGDLLSFDAYLKQAQEKFRKNGFPIFYDQIVKDVKITTDHGIKIEEQEKHTYHFISNDYEDGVVVSGGSLFVQTTNYKNFIQFSALAKKAHEIFSDVTEMTLIRAIGLRYVDLIEPKENKKWDYYLSSQILSPVLTKKAVSSLLRLECNIHIALPSSLCYFLDCLPERAIRKYRMT